MNRILWNERDKDIDEIVVHDTLDIVVAADGAEV